jgi:hypothetical protein
MFRRMNSFSDASGCGTSSFVYILSLIDGTLERPATLLTDFLAAWWTAKDERRNAMTRLLFDEERIKDEWIAAVWPQSNVAPFFEMNC